MISGRGPAKTQTVRLSVAEDEALAFIIGEEQRNRRWGRVTKGDAIRAAIHHYRNHLEEVARQRQDKPLAEALEDE